MIVERGNREQVCSLQIQDRSDRGADATQKNNKQKNNNKKQANKKPTEHERQCKTKLAVLSFQRKILKSH